MRNRFQFLLPVLDYLGALLWTSGFVLFVPLVILAIYRKSEYGEVNPFSFIIPAILALALGLVLKRSPGFKPLDSRGAMLLCVIGWIVVSAIGALPLWIAGTAGYLDSFFEAVSGFTTTGITMLSNLDAMPRSILFWRALMQWLGGLGILAFFLAVASAGGSAHALFHAESHKIFSERPAPGLFHTLKILWSIYVLFTLLITGLLIVEGMSVFDAVAQSMTALSTGGYSPHDQSIGYYAAHAGLYPHYVLIEYTVIVAMLVGGMSFLVHYRVLRGQISALWDHFEIKVFWAIVLGATVLVMTGCLVRSGSDGAGPTFRHSLFQVVSVMTTTGFGTKDIGGSYFPAVAKQVFLVLMVVGGCVGSTAGGFKVLRIGVLFEMLRQQLRRVIHGRSLVNPVTVDGHEIDQEELRRIAALFFAWMLLLFIGSGVTALLSDHGPLESASGMFSALGNIGPCYISTSPVNEMAQLHPIIKITYILGMLAGRLEILPVLLLFNRRTWR